jgi:hypothetical protein
LGDDGEGERGMMMRTHQASRIPRFVSIALLSIGILFVLAAGWVKTARDGYRVGAAEAYPVAYRQGVADGFAAGQRQAFKDCTPWGEWGNKSVVICQVMQARK